MNNVTKTDEIQDSLLNDIISRVEILPVFVKILELDSGLAKLAEIEVVKKSQLEDIASSLVGLREKVKIFDPAGLEKISKERVRLSISQAEITAFLSDLNEQRAEILKEKSFLQQALSEQARTIVVKLHQQENQEIAALVSIIEKRLQVWSDTAMEAHKKYFYTLGLAEIKNFHIYAPALRKACEETEQKTYNYNITGGTLIHTGRK